jgi:hypothetical protein
MALLVPLPYSGNVPWPELAFGGTEPAGWDEALVEAEAKGRRALAEFVETSR